MKILEHSTSKCPYCNLVSNRKIKKINTYELYYCDRCEFLFTDIRENRISVNNKVYNTDYLDRYDRRSTKLINRFSKRVKEIDKHTSGGCLLDIGCSTGLFLDSVYVNSSKKWKLFGIDLNLQSIIRAKKKLKEGVFKNGELISTSYKDDYFDVITCFDVLEHDKELKRTLGVIHKVLKPGGILVIQSPNYLSIMAKICGSNWDWWSVPDHIFHFSTHGLIKILQENKFKIINVNTWDPPYDFVVNVRGTIKLKLSKFSTLNSIIAKISSPFLYIYWAISLIHKYFFKSGGLILIYASK